VRGRSEPWSAVDTELAGALRHDLIDALYGRSRRLASTAAILQRSLLPDRLPDVPGWTLAAEYRPMVGGDVGGDWYDVVPLASGEVVCVLGDVAGHGVTAAGTMGQLRNGLRAYLVEEARPGHVLQRLSRLAEKLLPAVFATATVVVIDPATGTTRIASAGHPPVCLAPAAGEARLLPIEPGPPLGVLFGSPPAETTVTVGPGDLLVLYSDGMVERRSESMEIGLARLTRLCTGGVEAADLCGRLIADCRDPAGEDDATVLILRRDH
jgi:serine phosphatase RsbU (regulator of sigma subunit)